MRRGYRTRRVLLPLRSSRSFSQTFLHEPLPASGNYHDVSMQQEATLRVKRRKCKRKKSRDPLTQLLHKCKLENASARVGFRGANSHLPRDCAREKELRAECGRSDLHGGRADHSNSGNRQAHAKRRRHGSAHSNGRSNHVERTHPIAESLGVRRRDRLHGCSRMAERSDLRSPVPGWRSSASLRFHGVTCWTDARIDRSFPSTSRCRSPLGIPCGAHELCAWLDSLAHSPAHVL